MKSIKLDKREDWQRPKRRYTTPKLTVHGTIEEITQTVNPPPADPLKIATFL